jgi:hypothetical protein
MLLNTNMSEEKSMPKKIKQSHSGEGDNVGGSMYVNSNQPAKSPESDSDDEIDQEHKGKGSNIAEDKHVGGSNPANSSTANSSDDTNAPAQISMAERGVALAMALAVLLTFIFLVLNPRAIEGATLAIVRFLAASFAGIAGYLFSGTISVESSAISKTQVKAAGGFGAFVFVFFAFLYGIPVPGDTQ